MDTILEVQPNVEVGAEGKSSSDIAFELSETIMERIILKIDPDTCNPNHLKVRGSL